MAKNNNFLTIILYLVIISCFVFLIYHSQKNIKEGMDNLNDIKKDEDTVLKNINKKYGNAEFYDIQKSPFTYFEFKSIEASEPGWKGWGSIAPVMGGSQIDKNLAQAKVTMDLSTNLANTIENINNRKTLLRLMGINALGDYWTTLNPEFIRYYKDKMFFLDDIGKYVTGLCSKNDSCKIPGKSGGGNWWDFGFGNGDSGGDNDWEKNLENSWNNEWTDLSGGSNS